MQHYTLRQSATLSHSLFLALSCRVSYESRKPNTLALGGPRLFVGSRILLSHQNLVPKPDGGRMRPSHVSRVLMACCQGLGAGRSVAGFLTFGFHSQQWLHHSHLRALPRGSPSTAAAAQWCCTATAAVRCTCGCGSARQLPQRSVLTPCRVSVSQEARCSTRHRLVTAVGCAC